MEKKAKKTKEKKKDAMRSQHDGDSGSNSIVASSVRCSEDVLPDSLLHPILSPSQSNGPSSGMF